MNYKKKYIKYKIKYLLAKKLYGGMSDGEQQSRDRSDAVTKMDIETNSESSNTNKSMKDVNEDASASPRSNDSMSTHPDGFISTHQDGSMSTHQDGSMSTHPDASMNRGKRPASKPPPFNSPDYKKQKPDSPRRLASPRTPPIQYFEYTKQPK